MGYGDYVNGVMQEYGGELGRQTKFTVYLDIPRRISLNYGIMTQFDLLCKTITLPNVKQDPIEVKYKGHDIKLVGRTNFDQTFSVTLYVDELHQLRFALDNWIRMIDNKAISGENEELKREDMMGTLKVVSKNFDEDTTTREYEFHNVFPISVSAPEFAGDAPSAVQEITVEFGYSFFESREPGGLNFKHSIEDFTYNITNNIIDHFGGENLTVINSSVGRSAGIATIDFFKKLKNRI